MTMILRTLPTLRTPRARAAHRGLRLALLAPLLLALAACSSMNSLLEGERLDYKSEAKPSINALEVPPGLSTLPRDDRFNIPQRTGSATLSGYNLQQQRPGNAAAQSPMLPSVPNARLERAGNQRWLVVNKRPEEIWPVIKDFWQDMGFLINIESPETGVMETDWAENRAKIPDGIVRRTLGSVFDQLFSTGERDKFRVRLERTQAGTEIYLSHRGMVEEVNARQDSTIWQVRPSDPELEAEFLRRLLLRFGVEEERAKAVVNSTPEAPKARLVRTGNGPGVVQVDEGFDRAWRRVGLALDRVGFTVEDRDRTQGLYFVRYVDPEEDNKNKQPGFFARIFSFGSSDKAAQAAQYRIAVKGQSDNASQVSVLNRDGSPETSEVGSRILNLMQEQLR